MSVADDRVLLIHVENAVGPVRSAPSRISDSLLDHTVLVATSHRHSGILIYYPAPANGHTDSTTKVIGLALDSIEIGHPGGLALPVAVLRDRVTRFHQRKRACRFPEVAAELPGLIRDLHTTLATGANHGELLELAGYLHVHVTNGWLRLAAAPADLRHRVVFLARRLAQERNEVTTLGVAGFTVADTLLNDGAFALAKTELDSLTLPPTTAATAGLVGHTHRRPRYRRCAERPARRGGRRAGLSR
jgi:hypothetical protein